MWTQLRIEREIAKKSGDSVACVNSIDILQKGRISATSSKKIEQKF